MRWILIPVFGCALVFASGSHEPEGEPGSRPPAEIATSPDTLADVDLAMADLKMFIGEGSQLGLFSPMEQEVGELAMAYDDIFTFSNRLE